MKTAKHKITQASTTHIQRRDTETDKVLTDAGLRGIKHIDFNARILHAYTDLDKLKELQSRHGINSPVVQKELETRIAKMESDSRDWITEAGFSWADDADYAVTILVERVPR